MLPKLGDGAGSRIRHLIAQCSGLQGDEVNHFDNRQAAAGSHHHPLP